jgi:transcriptional regulator with XRE-family HTH domain
LTRKPEGPWVYASEFAERLGVSVRTLRRWEGEELVPKAERITRVPRWNRREVEKYLKQRGAQ